MSKGKIGIIYNEPSPGALPDELDILDQVNLSEESIRSLGYETCRIPIDFDLNKFIGLLGKEKPGIVMNLTESIANHGELLYFAPAVLNYLKIPYTGVRTESMFLTTSKTLAKSWMKSNGLPTAPWFELNEIQQLDPGRTYLVKPKLEDGSLGFDEDHVFRGKEISRVPGYESMSPRHSFIEEYIEGREFNISVLCSGKGPEVLPLAEILFRDFPKDKPRIIGYRAKWVDESFESKNTIRCFVDEQEESALSSELRSLALRCWDVFKLNGYVRIDFRMDSRGRLYILEINANPCISPGAGFYAACEKAGYSFAEVTQRILEDALKH
ncbi:MAG: ATP-grasp domain-containing protein [Bacteroidales bacterium]